MSSNPTLAQCLRAKSVLIRFFFSNEILLTPYEADSNYWHRTDMLTIEQALKHDRAQIILNYKEPTQ